MEREENINKQDRDSFAGKSYREAAQQSLREEKRREFFGKARMLFMHGQSNDSRYEVRNTEAGLEPDRRRLCEIQELCRGGPLHPSR